MISFRELLRCVGVDEEQKYPGPGVVVPLGGKNLVLLDTDGGKPLRVKSNNPAVVVKEVDGTEIRRKLIDMNIAVNQPDVDKKYKEEMLPTSMFWYDKPRFFEIRSKGVPISFPGTEIQASSGRGIEARIKAVVLEPKTVKIAIRHVQILDGTGRLAFHSSVLVDADKEKASMNAVWKPQANVTFDLISTEPVLINDKDPATRVKLGKAFGLNDPNNAVFPSELDENKLESFFAELRVPGALLTFFVVEGIKGQHSGVTLPSSGVTLISGKLKGQTTFAHEAGHYFLDTAAGQRYGHTFNKDNAQDQRELMRDGGAGWKVTFKVVEDSRKFFKDRKGF